MVFIIAECCVNFRSMSEADLMIKAAAEAGADACKFQAFKKHDIDGHPRADELKRIVLSQDDIAYLHYRCKQHGVELMVTPMYVDAIDMLDQYVKRWKVRCFDRYNGPLWTKLFDTGKEVIFSSQTLPENKYYWRKVLYCDPNYPPKWWPKCLSFSGFDGYSCHIPEVEHAVFVTKAFDLKYLEMHVRLDHYCQGYEPIDQKVSINMTELRRLCRELGH
jgi:sialic acid synthase SpsE